jgi:hypothetical protein
VRSHPHGTLQTSLIRPAAGACAAAKALIYRLAALKAGFYCMPVFYSGLAHSPAEQHHLAIEVAGKVEQAGVEILYLNADGIDLGYALADAL